MTADDLLEGVQPRYQPLLSLEVADTGCEAVLNHVSDREVVWQALHEHLHLAPRHSGQFLGCALVHEGFVVRQG